MPRHVESRTTDDAFEDCACPSTTATFNLYLFIPTSIITSVKMAGLLGKKFPTPVGASSVLLSSLAISAATSEICVQQLLTLFAIARPMAPFYVAGSSIPHTHFARLRNIRILILAQAPSSSTASTRLPLLSPTVSFARSSPPLNAICRLRCI